MGLPVDSLPMFLAATLALNFAPGPDVMFVVARSLQGSTRTGIAASLGISAGIVIHALLVSFGAAALLATWPATIKVLQLAGAAYLIWLAVSAWRAQPVALNDRATAESTRSVVAQGFITNVLNPKVALFFLLFLPQFIDPGLGPLRPQLLFLSFCFIVCGTLVNFAYAAASAQLGRWLRSSERYRALPHRVTALVLATIAGLLIWQTASDPESVPAR